MLLWESLLAGGEPPVPEENLLYVWGANANGELGLANSTNLPQDPTEVRSWRAFSFEQNGRYGITTDGKLWGWGPASYLGLGNTSSNGLTAAQFYSPTQIGTSSWVAVRSSYYNTYAIRADGRLFAWGQNSWGQLGLGDNLQRSSPHQIGTSSWTFVTSGSYSLQDQVAAIRQDGRLFMWGRNSSSQLGDGTTIDRSSPYQIGTSSWTTVATAGRATHAIRQDGKLFAWGNPDRGVLGIADASGNLPQIISWNIQQNITTRGTTVDPVTGGLDSGIATGLAGNTLYAWKTNSPPTAMWTDKSFAQISRGYEAAYGIDTVGRLWGWGYNNAGQLGLGDNVNRTSPTQIPGSWTAISANGAGNSGGILLAIKSDTTLWTWGYNAVYNGPTRSSPIQVYAPGVKSGWIAIEGGYATTFAIGQATTGNSNNWLFVMGASSNGVYPYYDRYSMVWDRYSSVAVSGADYYEQGAAVRADTGQLSIWKGGTEDYWNYSSQQFPGTLVLQDRSFRSVAAGRTHFFAIDTLGKLWAWGDNTAGKLGLGDTVAVNYFSPQQVGTSSWTWVSAGYQHTMAIRSDGRLFAWGDNSAGEIGDGTRIDRSSPYQIGTSSWSFVCAGYNNNMAIRQGGNLFAWGSNSQGQFQVGDFVDRSSPYQVGTSLYFTCGINNQHSIVIRQNGLVYCSGTNFYGQFGDFNQSYTQSPNPVQATSLGNIGTAGTYYYCIASYANSTVYYNNGSQYGWYMAGRFDNYANGADITGTYSYFVQSSGYNPSINQLQNGNKFADYYQRTFALSSYDNLFITNDSGNGFVYGAGMTKLWDWVGFDGGGPYGVMSGAGMIGQAIQTASQFQRIGARHSQQSWLQVSSDYYAALANTTAGQLYAWGYNGYQKLGTGDADNYQRSEPQGVGNNTTMFRMGSDNAIFIDSSGYSYASGRNNYGQVGTGNTTQESYFRNMQTQTGTHRGIFEASSENSMGVIQADGYLYAAGRGGYVYSSSLSRSTLTGLSLTIFSSPYQVGSNSWVAIAAAPSTRAAAGGYVSSGAGYLYTWGNNMYSGALGQNISTYLYEVGSPVFVSGSFFTALSSSATQDGTGFITRDLNGRAFMWGTSAAGDGVSAWRSSPVLVGGGYSYIALPNSIMSNLSGGITTLSRGVVWGSQYLGTALPSQSAGVPILLYPYRVVSPTQLGSRSWRQVSSNGTYANLAIDTTGQLWSWGGYFNGALGLGDNLSRSSPVQVGTDQWTQVANNGARSMAIRSDGLLFTWGAITGHNDNINRSSPTQLGTDSWKSINASNAASFAIRNDDTLWAWGTNSGGVLGLDSTISYSSPVQVPGSWSLIAGTGNHVLAVDSAGALWGWGYNEQNQVDGSGALYRSSPVQLGRTGVTYIAANFYSSMAMVGPTLWAWGSNAGGVLGLGTTDGLSLGQVNSAQDFVPSQTNPFVKQGGVWWASGVNTYGQLGLNTTSTSFNGGTALALSSDIVSVSPTAQQIQAFIGKSQTTGQAWVMGYNAYGALGLGDNIHRSSPTQMGTSSWSQIAAYSIIAAGISAGRLFVWGYNTSGYLGFNDYIDRSVPTQLGSSLWTQVSAGPSNFGAIRQDGRLFMWGPGYAGGIGDGNTFDRRSPYQVGTSSWTNVATQQYLGAGIRQGGTLFAWGYNYYGGVGDGTRIDRSSPYQIGTSSWTQVVGNYYGFAAIRSDGRLFAWGFNQYGQLGQNDTFHRSSPSQIGNEVWTKVYVGNQAVYAIRQDGTLWSWGYQNNASLGDQSPYASRSSPVQITGLYRYAFSPVQVPGSWTSVKLSSGQNSAGGYASAIDRQNRLFTWGYFGTYQSGSLGLDFLGAARSSPVQIMSATGYEWKSTGAPNNWNFATVKYVTPP